MGKQPLNDPLQVVNDRSQLSILEAVYVYLSVSLCMWLFIVSTIKRLHDMNKSGFWILLLLFPLILLLYLLIVRGTVGDNKYGSSKYE